MKTLSSEITFHGYTVDKLSFLPKSPANETDKSSSTFFIPSFTREIEGNEAGDCRVTLTAIVGQPDDNIPFTALVSITGQFKVPDVDKAHEIMEVNGTAILFPYLRAVMTQLTSAANLPPIYLPTINLVEMLRAKGKAEPDNKMHND